MGWLWLFERVTLCLSEKQKQKQQFRSRSLKHASQFYLTIFDLDAFVRCYYSAVDRELDAFGRAEISKKMAKPEMKSSGSKDGKENEHLPFNLTDLDREVLQQTDEEFVCHDWEEMKQIVGRNPQNEGPPWSISMANTSAIQQPTAWKLSNGNPPT